MGADTAMGIKDGDWSVAQVLDSKSVRWLRSVVRCIQITLRKSYITSVRITMRLLFVVRTTATAYSLLHTFGQGHGLSSFLH